jgi:type IV pilus assembly protein PilY1
MAITFWLILYSSIAFGYTPTPDSDMGSYTAVPPFVTGGTVKPNVLIMLDNSGSMYEFAYKTPGTSDVYYNPDMSYNSGSDYFGYFDKDTMYSYSTSSGGYFYADSGKTLDKTNFWSGNLLNWLTMRRVDVVRKVLVGGKAVNRASNNPRFLIGAEDPDRNYWKKTGGKKYLVWYGSSTGRVGICNNDNCSYLTDLYNIKILSGNTDPQGLIQKTQANVRFGVMSFNTGNKYSREYYPSNGVRDGGYVNVDIGSTGTNLVTQIENTDPTTWTPLGESLYESIRYFEATNTCYNGNATYSGKDPIQYTCQKNFVLILTDGESTEDKNIPGTYWTGSGQKSDPYGFNVRDYMDSIASNEGYSSQWNQNANSMAGSYYLEGIAFYAHTNDLRSSTTGSSELDDTQSLNVYTVFAFDDSSVGRDLLQKTAKYGGFKDGDGDNLPFTDSTCGTASPDARCKEWDNDGDGVPDTYYEASNAQQLETQLTTALLDILKRAASGSAVSVISTTGEGDGALYQAYFFPSKLFGTVKVDWIGYLSAFLVDSHGNMREDSNGNRTLDMDTDRIIKMQYDQTNGAQAKRYRDPNGNGLPDDCVSNSEFCYYDTVSLENVLNLWNGGTRLFNQSASGRTIYTHVTTGFTSFADSNATTLKPLLRAADDTESANIINYIRGIDASGYRSRTVTVGSTTGVWKLGDIINSSPSTVSRPMENYDQIYGDSTYSTFKTKYHKRRTTVYVGGNDGMLHAFNGGYYDSSTKKFWTAYNGTTYSDTGTALGNEIWAYIPKALLPHLKWLTRTDYNHVYYVDLTPKVVDARIFDGEVNNPNGKHPYGWGTILIGGMRLGGKSITTQNEILYSSYFVLDITDPDNPEYLWSYTPDNNSLTLSRPGVARIIHHDISTGLDIDNWYMISGSGPGDYDGFSNPTTLLTGELYVVDLKTGSLLRKFTTSESKAYFSDVITVDVMLDNKIDMAYVGESYYVNPSSKFDGKMLRLTTKNDMYPANWTLSTLYSTPDPITSAPTVALDKRGNLWTFFGSGQYIGTNDKNTTDSGRFYGIKDSARPWLAPYTNTSSYTNLLDVSNSIVNFGGNSVSVAGTSSITNWNQLINQIYTHDGWFINFPTITSTTDFLGNTITHAGERIISKPLVLGGLVLWTSYIPGTDQCAYEGTSNFYGAYYETGTSYYSYIFDEEKAMKQGSTNPETVSRSMNLGVGMPSTIGGMVTAGGTLKGFVQQSTGAVLQVETNTPFKLKSGIAGWKEENL